MNLKLSYFLLTYFKFCDTINTTNQTKKAEVQSNENVTEHPKKSFSKAAIQSTDS